MQVRERRWKVVVDAGILLHFTELRDLLRVNSRCIIRCEKTYAYSRRAESLHLKQPWWSQ